MVSFKREEDFSQYVNKAKQDKAASGGSAPGGGSGGYVSAPAFGQFASSGSGGAGPRIPVWRTPTPIKDRYHPGNSSYDSPAVMGAPRGLFERPAAPKPEDPATFDADGAVAQFGKLLTEPDLMEEWAGLAYRAGMIGSEDVNDAAKLEAVWGRAVGWSMSIASATGKLLTPFEVLQQVADTTGAGILAGQNDAQRRARAAQEQRDWDYAHFTGTRDMPTTTDTDKQAGVRNTEALHQLLGRNPTGGELAAFQHGMNEIAAENPTVTKRKGTFEEGHQTSQTDTVTGGYDEAAAVRAQASSASPEVAANQRATTYFDALKRAIESVV